MHRTWNATDYILRLFPWGTLPWIMQVLYYAMLSEGHPLQTNETEHLQSAKWMLTFKKQVPHTILHDPIGLKSMDTLPQYEETEIPKD